MVAWRPNVGALRTVQEGLMEDTCVITRLGTPLVWSRTGDVVIPCRVGEERTLAVPGDPEDANVRSLSEWTMTMPWDVRPEMADVATATISRTGETVEGVVGENNNPQTWLICARVYITKQKTAVQSVMLTFKRDDNFDGVFETTLGPYAVKVLFDRVEPFETPLRYAPSARASYKPARLIFENQPNVPVEVDDIFTYNGFFGTISAVVPGQVQRTEAHAWIDFSGVN